MDWLDMVADLVVTIAAVHHADVVHHTRILDFAIRGLDKTVVVDAGIAA